MPQASEIAWLIPVFPLIGAVLSGLGLISINKKINNSREIVSVGLISFAVSYTHLRAHETRGNLV